MGEGAGKWLNTAGQKTPRTTTEPQSSSSASKTRKKHKKMSNNTPRYHNNMDKLLNVAPEIGQVHLVLWGEPTLGTYSAHNRPEKNVVVKLEDNTMESVNLTDVKCILIGDLNEIREVLANDSAQ